MTNKLLSVKDVKQITGWSESTIYNLIKAGTLKSIKLPHTPHRINITELDSLLDGALLNE